MAVFAGDSALFIIIAGLGAQMASKQDMVMAVLFMVQGSIAAVHIIHEKQPAFCLFFTLTIIHNDTCGRERR